MLSSRLLRLVSEHWEEIADRVMRAIRRDSRLLEFGKLPEEDLRGRAREILQNLAQWMTTGQEGLAGRYEALGRLRYEEGIPLHEIVYALQLLRESMIQYVHDQGLGATPLELEAENELEFGADRIFDAIVYYFIRGYERAMRERSVSAA